jgi:hypothetical protein
MIKLEQSKIKPFKRRAKNVENVVNKSKHGVNDKVFFQNY